MAEQAKEAFIFDLDGTLVDSVYQHVLAWHEALTAVGIEMSVWRIHRRIGMSGGLLTRALMRESNIPVTDEMGERLRALHADAYLRRKDQVRPLPGAKALLRQLSEARFPWAIATSGRMETARATVATLEVDVERCVLITRDMVRHAKPNPDLFLAAAERLGVPIASSFVVGDSVWDLLAATRAGALGIGLLS
ncbi:MAG: HAD family hydrolase, partial [Rhodospirillaceae bacterium]|nr:HAD family hydrolase [Rhodospirillaceae bacterium]